MFFEVTKVLGATLALFSASALAAPVDTAAVAPQKTLFLLAGDSTTAKQSYPDNGGGWGNGFINFTLNNAVASAQNWGHDGATTASFQKMGDWQNVLNICKQNSKTSRVYVTIQFGHNDQKLGMDFMPTYKQNLKNMIYNVTTNGGTPIIVSPLSRRNFQSDNKTLSDTLQPWRDAALKTATANHAHSIDLWLASTTYVSKIGAAAAHRLNLAPLDNTHLNIDGSIVFGRMVADLINSTYPSEFKGVFKADAKLSKQIAEGVPTF